MLRLDAIRDPELLRQVAGLLERENEKLHTKVQSLIAELARLRGDAARTAQHDLEFLKELLAQRERALFGASSERRPAPKPPEVAPASAPQRGHGPTAQLRLPRVEMVHELAAADQTCPQCGGTLHEMKNQTEDSEEITVVERRSTVRGARATFRSASAASRRWPRAPRARRRRSSRSPPPSPRGRTTSSRARTPTRRSSRRRKRTTRGIDR